MIDGRRYLATAAHVLTCGPVSKEDAPLPRIKEQHSTIYAGPLVIKPLSVRIDFEHDLALMEFADADWNKLDIMVFDLSSKSPCIEDKAKIWGCVDKASPDPQLKDAPIVAVTRHAITAGCPVDHGFSGGPVLDRDNRLIGIVSRTESVATVVRPAGFLRQLLLVPACEADEQGWIVR
jgi:hypothetical protein